MASLKRILFLIPITLAGCGDGISDASYDEAMIREAYCIVASLRFGLYEEAEEHHEHGLEAGRLRFEQTNELNDFSKILQDVRLATTNLSKDFHAEYLATRCNRNITVGEFENAD
ncbi:MAG: hypothetical protein ABJN26_16680 [Stappiaceae bacterium]